MQPIQVERERDSRLRFVFGDAVLSFSVAPEVTLGEIARRFGELSSQRRGAALAIDVTIGSGVHESIRPVSSRPGLESTT